MPCKRRRIQKWKDKLILNSYIIRFYQRRRQDFGSGGGTFQGVGLVGGPGGGAPRTPENFENFQKISQENCKNWIILVDFSKKLKNPALNFRALDEKPIV